METFRFGVTAALAMMLTVIMANPASADYKYRSGWVYETTDLCVWNRTETSHGDGGGYSKVDNKATHEEAATGINCLAPQTKPAGYLKNKFKWFKHAEGQWALCASTGWVKNDDSAAKFVIHYNYGSSPWCGKGWYTTHGWAKARNGDNWYGGDLWSGKHYLPAS